MPAKVRAVRHLEFLPDSFDAGSNQVSDTDAGRSVCREDLYQFLSYSSLFIQWFPDCYKDLTLLVYDVPSYLLCTTYVTVFCCSHFLYSCAPCFLFA